MGTLLNRRRYMGGGNNIPLPPGYTKVKSIITEGKSVTKLDVSGSALQSFHIKLKMWKVSGVRYFEGTFLGNRARANTNTGSIVLSLVRGKLTGTGITFSFVLYFTEGTLYDIYYSRDDGTMIINGTSYSVGLASGIGDVLLNLGARDYASSTGTFNSPCHAEYFEVEVNGNNYVPCKTSSNVGLLRLDTETFFTSITEYQFIEGT